LKKCFRPCNWEEALFMSAQKLRQIPPSAMACLAGSLVDTGKFEILVFFFRDIT